MSGFLGIGGKNSKQQNQSISNLSNLFNFGFGQSQALTPGGTAKLNTGAADLGSAAGYFGKLASGNRPAMQAAIAPATNATLSAADAARRNRAAQGTARGGGVAGQNQQQQTDTQAKIDNALFAVQPEAAKELAQTGSAEAQVGAEQLGAALGFGNLAGTSTSNAGQIATNARSQSLAAQSGLLSDIFGFIPKPKGA